MASATHSIQSETNSNQSLVFLEEAINFFSSGKWLTLRKGMPELES
jgi:hypothetical protein